MPQANNQAEIDHINRDHLLAAQKAVLFGSAKAPYDTHEYSDSYFKFPENEQDRMFETIRQMASEAKQITTVIPAYFNEKKYEENEKGEGALAQYKQLISHMTELAGYYVYTYTALTIDKDLKQVIDEVEVKIQEFFKQAEVIFHPGKERFTLESNLEPFASILKEPGNRYISDLREQYGPEFTLCLDLTNWVDTSHVYDLNKQVGQQSKYLEEMQKNEKYHEEKKRISAVIETVKAFRLSSSVQYDPEKALDLLQSFEREHFGFFVDRDHSELTGQIKWYNKEKDNIFQELRNYFIAHSETLAKLEFSKLRFVLTSDVRKDSTKLVTAFVRSSSPDQLMNFISQDYSYHPCFSFSRPLYYDTENSNTQSITEKQKKVGDFALEKFASIRDEELEQNWATYSYLLGYISLTKELDAISLGNIMKKIADVYPKNLFFKIHHPAQMNQFCDFLEYLFLQTLDRQDIPKDMAAQFISQVEQHDQRYEKVNKRLDSIARRMHKRYVSISSEM